jgi:hypothetical protein
VPEEEVEEVAAEAEVPAEAETAAEGGGPDAEEG